MKRIIRGIIAFAVSLLVLWPSGLSPAQGQKVSAASAGTATWCIELFTVGGGYLAEPVEMAIRPGENAARQLVRLLHETGYVGYYGGTLDSQFYLAYVGSGTQTETSYNGYQNSRIAGGAPKKPKTWHMEPKVPAVLDGKIRQALEQGDAVHYYDLTDYTAGYLGEFDVSNGSGWMFSVNNTFPGVGFADTYLSDGDVVRVQFTLAYGNDIGGGQGVGSGYGSAYYAVANKDRLTQLMAKARRSACFADSGVQNAYRGAKTAAAQVDASQSYIDAACDTLRQALAKAGTTTAASVNRPDAGTAATRDTPAAATTAYAPGKTSAGETHLSTNTSVGGVSDSESTRTEAFIQENTAAGEQATLSSGGRSEADRPSGGSRWIGWLIGGLMVVGVGAGAVGIILYRNRREGFAHGRTKEDHSEK